MMNFDVGSKVIVKKLEKLRHNEWEVAEIVANDGKPNKADRDWVRKHLSRNLQNNESVLYRVRLIKSRNVRPVIFENTFSNETATKKIMREWTGENIIRCRGVPVKFLSQTHRGSDEGKKASSSRKDNDYYLELYLLAVKLRRIEAIRWLYKTLDSSKSFNVKSLIKLGCRVDDTFMSYKYAKEKDSKILAKQLSNLLLKLAVHSEQVSMTEDSDAYNEESSVKKLEQELIDVFDWLKKKHSIDYKDYEDNLERTPEHVAALRGDYVLMHYILRKKVPSCDSFDYFKTSPIMYAVTKGNANILDLYTREIFRSNRYERKTSNEFKDIKIDDSYYELAKDDETKTALSKLQAAMEGSMKSDTVKSADFKKDFESRESEFRNALFGDRPVKELKFMMQMATNDVALADTKISQSIADLDLLILGYTVAWQKALTDDVPKRCYLDKLILEDRLEVVEWVQSYFAAKQRLSALEITVKGGHLDALELLHPIIREDMPVLYRREESKLIEIAVVTLQLESANYLLTNRMVETTKLGTQLMKLCLKPYDFEIRRIAQKFKIDPTPQDRLEMIQLLDKYTTEEIDYQCFMMEAINTIRRGGPDSKCLLIPESIFDWLLDEKEVDILYLLECVEGPEDPVFDTGHIELLSLYQQAREIESDKIKTSHVLQLQRRIRGNLTRRRIKNSHPDFGIWAELILKINKMKKSNLPESFGKTWAELKLEYNYVAQSNEYEIYEDEALGVMGDEEGFEQETKLEKQDGIVQYSEDMIGESADEVKVLTILLTSESLKWLRMQKDQKYRELFHKRINQLANGGQSYCLSKRLKGSRHGAFETKLDKGQRIIWTQRGKERMIWFICKHDKISRCCELIDLSYDRVLKDEAHEEIKFTSENSLNKDEPEMLANPIANVPLKIHSVDVDDLDRLLIDVNWTPPLKLTSNEELIVTQKGTVLLLGRSGTGKTLCVCNRMARDRLVHKPRKEKFRQLFVSRTSRLCEYVEALQKRAGEDLTAVAMRRVDDFVDEMSRLVEPTKTWQDCHYISYEKFCSDNVLPIIKGTEKELDALQIWTQFRSFIKGSYESVRLKRPLTREEYLGLSKDRCRLHLEQRRRAYDIFEVYQRLLDKNGWWDEVDKARHVYTTMEEKFTELVGEGVMPLYTHIYVDEIQDITQAEIALLFLVSGNNYKAMFFAGDTAQTVSQGVDFRFEEIRSIVYGISEGRFRLQRPEKLTRNFRSHNGILSVSNLVLDKLHAAFPAAASKLPPDTGLVLGPRPGLIMMDYDEISNIFKENTRIRILVRDELKAGFQQKLRGAGNACLGIRDAKGLEFRDVVILDFFRGIPDKIHNKAWKQLLIGDPATKIKASTAILDLPVSMELELKLLYTAITRSCDRLFFIETGSSQAWSAWRRCLKKDDLAIEIKSDVIGDRGVMTADDWLIEGIEMASQVSDIEVSGAKRMLLRAINHFQKANNKVYEQRCFANLRALEFLGPSSPDKVSEDDKLTRKRGNEVVDAYLDAGLVSEAARHLRYKCTSPGLEKFLRKEIMSLRKVVRLRHNSM